MVSGQTGQRDLADKLEQRNWRDKYQHLIIIISSTQLTELTGKLTGSKKSSLSTPISHQSSTRLYPYVQMYMAFAHTASKRKQKKTFSAGTDVMIFKILSSKNLAKILAFFAQTM
jgi:hypothetical protein